MISICEPITVQIGSKEKISIDIQKESGTFPEYPGPFTFTPSTQTQTIQIAMQKSPQNISILPVPYSQVLNPAGGYTVTIL